MTRIAIRAENLGKRYRLGQLDPYGTLRDTLARVARAPLRFRSSRREGNEGSVGNPHPRGYIWALRNVSFEVKESEALGIIGPNGAGKTTLLKVLSRITEPTEGWVELRGRVGSLLEVGTGFHPELTGKENVYLNGAVLGMTKREIDERYKEIVHFSELEEFMNTPVKRFSSGMQVRLAFAVAAHLEPEVLLVDEVLAVGDAAFQKKCLGRMSEVTGSGRTVLFVSHNLAAVKNLCERAILLDKGQLLQQGTSEEITEAYLSQALGPSSAWHVDSEKLVHGGPVRITDIRVETITGEPLTELHPGDGLCIRIKYKATKSLVSPSVVVKIRSLLGTEVVRLSNMPISGFPIEHLEGEGEIRLTIASLPLTSGRYTIDIGLARQGVGYYFNLEDIFHLDVSPRDVYGGGMVIDQTRGLVVVPHRWEYLPKNEASRDSGWIGDAHRTGQE